MLNRQFELRMGLNNTAKLGDGVRNRGFVPRRHERQVNVLRRDAPNGGAFEPRAQTEKLLRKIGRNLQRHEDPRRLWTGCRAGFPYVADLHADPCFFTLYQRSRALSAGWTARSWLILRSARCSRTAIRPRP